jgi:hemoglobin-like flavoprotein
MTPDQISNVEKSLASLDIEELAVDFYRRAFDTSPDLMAMFTTDAAVQRRRFGAELDEIMRSIRSFDDFRESTRALGARHRGYGVRAPHYALMGEALLAALAHALGPQWTEDLALAWTLAYNMTAESMMLGAMEDESST